MEMNDKTGDQKRNNLPSPASTSETPMATKIMYLTLKRTNMTFKTDKSTVIKIPVTYQACQRAAYNAFKADLVQDAKENDVILQIKRGEKRSSYYGFFDSWSVVTPEAYSILLSTSGDSDCIDLVVSGPLKPSGELFMAGFVVVLVLVFRLFTLH